MRIILLNIFVSFLLFSCKTKSNSKIVSSYKDIVLKQYIDYTSNLPYFFDYSNYDYRFLKAYYNNDTAYLKNISDKIAIADLKKSDGFPDSSRRHPIIGKLDVDEVYQLNYSESFCNLGFYFTIIKNKDTVSLNSVIYQRNDKASSLQVVKETNTRLTLQNWTDFVSLIDYADFWGLNQYKKFGCCDGDFLTVKGIIRNRSDHSIVEQHQVNRQFVSQTALYKPYQQLLKYSNYKSDCKY